METLTIELTNPQAIKLLTELEELHLIRVIRKDTTDTQYIRRKVEAFLATLPSEEPPLSEADIISEIKAIRAKRNA